MSENNMYKYGQELEGDIVNILEIHAKRMINNQLVTPTEMVTVITGGVMFPFAKLMHKLNIPVSELHQIVDVTYEKMGEENKRQKKRKQR